MSATETLLTVFEVKCKACGSTDITVFTDVFCHGQGAQGVVKIKCVLCDARAEIWKAPVKS